MLLTQGSSNDVVVVTGADWTVIAEDEAQAEAIGIVMTAMDADAVMIIEAPDNNRRRQTVPMLERFAARYDLRCRRGRQQKEGEDHPQNSHWRDRLLWLRGFLRI